MASTGAGITPHRRGGHEAACWSTGSPSMAWAVIHETAANLGFPGRVTAVQREGRKSLAVGERRAAGSYRSTSCVERGKGAVGGSAADSGRLRRVHDRGVSGVAGDRGGGAGARPV